MAGGSPLRRAALSATCVLLINNNHKVTRAAFFIHKTLWYGSGLLFGFALLAPVIQYILYETGLTNQKVDQLHLGLNPAVVVSLVLILLLLARWPGEPSHNDKQNQPAAKLVNLLQRLDLRLILVLALILRLGWVLVGEVKLAVDFLEFDRKALAILRREFWIEPTVPIGSSIIFAIHYYLFGHDSTYPLISIAILSTIQIFLVYDLAKALSGSSQAAKLAALLLAVWPEHFLYVNLLGSDVLYSSFLLAALWFLSKGLSKSGWLSLALTGLSGLLIGVSHWIRQTSPVFMLAILITLFFWKNPLPVSTSNWKKWLSASLAFSSGIVILITPILYYNLTSLNMFSIYAAQGFGWGVLVGSNIEHQGRWNASDFRLLEEAQKQQALNPENKGYSSEHPLIAWDRLAFQLGIDRILEQPLQFIQTAIWYKIPLLWGISAHLGWSFASRDWRWAYPRVEAFANTWHRIILLLAAISAFSLARSAKLHTDWNILSVYLLALFPFALVHLLVEVQPRYHHLFLPFLTLLIAQAWAVRSKAYE